MRAIKNEGGFTIAQDEATSVIYGMPKAAYETGCIDVVLPDYEILEEIVRLVGIDALSANERLVLEAAKSIREDYLHQNAFHDVDTYTSLHKQYRMLKLIMSFYYKGKKAIEQGAGINELFNLPVRYRIGRTKYTNENEVDSVFDSIENDLDQQMESLVSKEVG